MNASSELLRFPVPPVVKTVRLRCSAATAFERFTHDIHLWWPLQSHSLGGSRAVHVGFEPHAGGRLFERDEAGAESTWGRVVDWQPPARLVFTWHVGRAEDTAQLVELSFREEGGGTQVQLVHWGWERLGEAGAAARAEYDSGWNFVFASRFAGHAQADAQPAPRLVVVHSPGPGWRPGVPPSGQPGVQEHVEHYRRLAADGLIEGGGPFLDEAGGGMMIAREGVTPQVLEPLAESDPTVRSGLLRYAIRPWLMALSQG